MNPSSSGWIDKYIFILEKSNANLAFSDEKKWYASVHRSGFIYGYAVDTIIELPNNTTKLVEEELTKANLLHTLLAVYSTQFNNHQPNNVSAIESILGFYTHFTPRKESFLQKITGSYSSSRLLEQVIHERVTNNKPLLRYPQNKILTHALLFVDVLVFRQYLKNPDNLDVYFNHLESSLFQVLTAALQVKLNRSVYDDLIVALYKETKQYAATDNTSLKQAATLFTTVSEQYYILDLCCLALWEDHTIETSEKVFIENVADTLRLQQIVAEERLESLKQFEKAHAKTPTLFYYKHPVKQFYLQSSKTVKLLILRNKNRLLKELMQSKELLVLLGKSTYKDLDTTEKQKVKEQLIDICKAVPSLTIFLLPGGSLLLPLLIKFIPQLLPDAFDDNKIPKSKS